MASPSHAAHSGPLPNTACATDTTAFFPAQAARSHVEELPKERFVGNDRYLATHPNVKGRTNTAIDQWPIYGDHPAMGMRHYTSSPTYRSTSDFADVGVIPVRPYAFNQRLNTTGLLR
jgi:hypothetical protein